MNLLSPTPPVKAATHHHTAKSEVSQKQCRSLPYELKFNHSSMCHDDSTGVLVSGNLC